MKPLVTIVIPFYNDPYIAEAIESALSQTYPRREIVVVDDGSTSYTELIQPFLSRIRYLRKKNGGTASALNYGIHRTVGDYIAWLSSDDRFYPNKIAHQVGYMIEHGAYFSHTNFDLIDGSGHLIEQGAGMIHATALQFYDSFLHGNCINGCTVMLNRKLLKRVGGFHEQLPYTHDMDLWYRIMLEGFDMHYIPECLTAYRRHEAMGTIRHRDAIMKEVQVTMKQYQARMQQFIARIQHD